MSTNHSGGRSPGSVVTQLFVFVPVRKAAVRSVRLRPGRQDGDLQERLRGVVSAGRRHQGGVSLSGPRQSRLQPSEERQGPVPGHLQGEESRRPAERRVRPEGLQPGPVQPEPHEHAQIQTLLLLHLPYSVERRAQTGTTGPPGASGSGGFQNQKEKSIFIIKKKIRSVVQTPHFQNLLKLPQSDQKSCRD